MRRIFGRRRRRPDRRAAPRCGARRRRDSCARSRRSRRAWRRRRSDARPASAASRSGCASPWRGCARASSRRRHRSPRRNSAPAAPAARSTPTGSSPSPRLWAGRTRTTRRCGVRRRARSGWRDRAVHHATSRRPGCTISARVIARQPQRHRDLAVGARLGRQSSCASPARGRTPSSIA